MTLPNPVCTCCGCGIYSDAFSSSLAGSWTVSSGTWATSGGSLAGTGAGLLYNTTADPDGVGQSVSLSLRYAFMTSGAATFRFLISLLDTSNYLYAQIERSAGGSTQVTLGEVVAGVDTELSDPIPIESSVLDDDFRTAKLCYFYPEERLRFSDGPFTSGEVGVEVDAVGIGDKIGIQIVSADDGEFDDVAYGRAYSAGDADCESCNPTTCSIGTSSLTGSVDSFFWETVTGSWGSGYVPSGDSILRYLRPHPLGKSTMHLEIDATVTSGETVRGYVNYLDVNNHLYADAGWDSTTVFRLSLYRVSSGTPTLLDERFTTLSSGTSFDKNLQLKVCYDGTSLSAEAINSSTGQTLHGSSAATEITDGVWCAIGSNGGPEFFNFNFQKYYSATDPDDDDCPVCPTGCGCHASHVPRGNYTVDFGAGGWTDDACDYCDQVAGEFVLGEWGDSSGTCQTVYLEEAVCVTTECPGSTSETKALTITLSLVNGSVSPNKKWQLTVILENLSTSNPSCCDSAAKAVYESADIETDECDVVPVTLSKVSDTVNEGNCSGAWPVICGGALPSTITLDET